MGSISEPGASEPQARAEAHCLEDSGSWQARCSWHGFPHDKNTSHQKVVFLSPVITELESTLREIFNIYIQIGNTLTLIILLLIKSSNLLHCHIMEYGYIGL